MEKWSRLSVAQHIPPGTSWIRGQCCSRRMKCQSACLYGIHVCALKWKLLGVLSGPPHQTLCLECLPSHKYIIYFLELVRVMLVHIWALASVTSAGTPGTESEKHTHTSRYLSHSTHSGQVVIVFLFFSFPFSLQQSITQMNCNTK